MRKTWLTAVLLVPALLFAQADDPALGDGAAGTDFFARDTYRIESLVCPFKGSIDYDPGSIECGLLQVPENREKPDSRYIELMFVKLNSTWDDEAEDSDEEESKLEPGKRDDVVIYLTGGPGAHAAIYVDRFKEHRIRKHRDMYILEQRGIANSGDFCLKYASRKPEIYDVETFDGQQQAAVTAASDCAANAMAAGVDLSGYNTIENARDVQALRIALGLAQWNVWGISYGSILGQAYIKQDPAGIRAIVLDSIVPLNAGEDFQHWRFANSYIRDLRKLDELCRADEACSETYPDLEEKMRQAAQAVIDEPIVVKVKDIELYPSGEARFFSSIAALLPFVLLYEQTNYPGLPGMIYAWADILERRDETFFRAIAQASDDEGFGGISQGMYNAILCLDGFRRAQIQSNEADREEHPVFSRAIGSREFDEKTAQVCVDMGMAPRDGSEYEPVQTDLPALIVAGDMDPVTPPPLAKAIVPGFSNGTYVEFPYTGHGPLRSVECGGDLLNLFYDNPTAEPDLSCVDEVEPPEFYVPLYTTAFVPRLLLIAVEDEKKLAAPAAWGGMSVCVSLIAFVWLSAAPLGRRIDKRQAVPVGGARWSAWLSALFATAATAIIGAAFGVTADASELLPAFGLITWAWWGALAGVLAGLLGLAAVVLTIRARMQDRLPVGTLIGLILTGLAAVGLSTFLLYWDLGPF